MIKYSKNKIIDEFLKQGDEIEKNLSKAVNSNSIKKILKSYGKSPYEVEEIYWKLKACGASEYVALAVINKSKFLKKYLKMKSEGISDIEVTAKMSALLN